MALQERRIDMDNPLSVEERRKRVERAVELFEAAGGLREENRDRIIKEVYGTTMIDPNEAGEILLLLNTRKRSFR
jgi:hypothetical protein